MLEISEEKKDCSKSFEGCEFYLDSIHPFFSRSKEDFLNQVAGFFWVKMLSQPFLDKNS